MHNPEKFVREVEDVILWYRDRKDEWEVRLLSEESDFQKRSQRSIEIDRELRAEAFDRIWKIFRR